MKKATPLLILVLLALIFLVARNWEHRNTAPANQPGGGDPGSIAFERRVDRLEYTEHAKCRMSCRQVSRQDVEDILREGTIIRPKSDMNDKPCPSFALEGRTRDKERLRIVYAQCDNETRVVTVINLDKEFHCNCP